MPTFFFDVRVGAQTFRDRYGAEYDEVAAAESEMREALLELARYDALGSTEYELVLRNDLRPVRKVRLTVSVE